MLLSSNQTSCQPEPNLSEKFNITQSEINVLVRKIFSLGLCVPDSPVWYTIFRVGIK